MRVRRPGSRHRRGRRRAPGGGGVDGLEGRVLGDGHGRVASVAEHRPRRGGGGAAVESAITVAAVATLTGFGGKSGRRSAPRYRPSRGPLPGCTTPEPRP